MMLLINKQREKGFTLIELMIVVAIIGILAAIAIPQFSEYRKKAFNGAANADLRNAMTAEEAYYAENQDYIAEPAGTVAGGQLPPRQAKNLPAVRISKNVQLKANKASATATAPAEYAAFTGHIEGSQRYGGDSTGRIERNAQSGTTTPASSAAGETITSLSGWGGTAL